MRNGKIFCKKNIKVFIALQFNNTDNYKQKFVFYAVPNICRLHLQFSFNGSATRKLFRTNNMDIVRQCHQFVNFDLPITDDNRTAKLESQFIANCSNLLYSS